MKHDLRAPPRALVVGGSSAIGTAIAEEFVRRGMEVLATYHRHAPAEPGRVEWRQLDVASEASIAAFVTEVEASRRCLDVVVVVAGILRGEPLEQYDLLSIDEVMRVNFGGPATLLARLLPSLADPSCIVMFSSVSGERGSYDPVYAASKGAVIAFVKSLATRLAPKTRCIAVAPGLVEGTGMYAAMKPERQAFHREAAPLGRLITPGEIARIVHELTQDHWAHANGSCVRINGGAYV
jgi:3-oxoacyl-[acyl-carrier protein] reductase